MFSTKSNDGSNPSNYAYRIIYHSSAVTTDFDATISNLYCESYNDV